VSLLMPPIAFTIVLAACAALSWGMSRLSSKRRKGVDGLGPYACGENLPSHLIQPDYGQFLPFAIFFTILHVLALVLSTVPTEDVTTFVIAMVYLLAALVGLTVLYRK
jgi:NADH:ubiquinone oxidoreductase subunit 3 (subunit A)